MNRIQRRSNVPLLSFRREDSNTSVIAANELFRLEIVLSFLRDRFSSTVIVLYVIGNSYQISKRIKLIP